MLNLIKQFVLFLFTIIVITGTSYSQVSIHKESGKNTEPTGVVLSDGVLYGKDYDQSMTVIEFEDLLKSANDYDDKVVLVKGNVSEVCQKMGCWMTITSGSDQARVKTLHEFFLPKDIAGQKAIVIGTFKVTEISEEQARHYNDETKNPKVKSEEIKGPQKVYELEAMGIKILNSETDSKKN